MPMHAELDASAQGPECSWAVDLEQNIPFSICVCAIKTMTNFSVVSQVCRGEVSISRASELRGPMANPKLCCCIACSCTSRRLSLAIPSNTPTPNAPPNGSADGDAHLRHGDAVALARAISCHRPSPARPDETTPQTFLLCLCSDLLTRP